MKAQIKISRDELSSMVAQYLSYQFGNRVYTRNVTKIRASLHADSSIDYSLSEGDIDDVVLNVDIDTSLV